MNVVARRLVMVGFGLSEPGTMGGNTKIALEAARGLCAGREVHLVVPERKLATVTDAVGKPRGLVVHAVRSFKGSDMRRPIASARHCATELRRVFAALGVGAGDDVYSCSDFHVDTVPCFLLQREFGYRWVAVQFLFVPSPVENLFRRWGFPVFRYALVWLYSVCLFRLARLRAEAFVITNDSDRSHFPKAFQERVFPFYGGVNVDQIPPCDAERTRDVVFCSRLCEQKGIWGFLDVWRRVLIATPGARLAVIGNGAPEFERALRAKAQSLGVADSIDWLGYVNGEEKYAVYRSARVFVHPTVFDNNGMVAAEALCSGLPVVMYDLPPLRHVYTMGCVKVPRGDKEKFAHEVARLLSDAGHSCAVAPDAEQTDALRAFWNWPERIRRFAAWLDDEKVSRKGRNASAIRT